MKKELIVSEHVRTFCEKVMSDNGIDVSPAEVEYVLVSPHITKTTPAKVTRSNDLVRLFSEADYVVQVSEDVWNKLPEDTKVAMMLTLLRRINPVYKEKKDGSGEWKFNLSKYDFQGMKSVMNTHGVQWFFDMQTMISSVYDLSPEQADRVSL